MTRWRTVHEYDAAGSLVLSMVMCQACWATTATRHASSISRLIPILRADCECSWCRRTPTADELFDPIRFGRTH